MLTQEVYNIAGQLTVKKEGLDGNVVEEVKVSNQISLSGRELIAKLYNRDKTGDTIPRVSKICLGSSQDAFDPKQDALVQKVGETAITTIEEEDVADSTGCPRKMLRLSGVLAEADCNFELREAGLFTEDDVMYNRVIFDTITKSNQFKLTFIWEITF